MKRAVHTHVPCESYSPPSGCSASPVSRLPSTHSPSLIRGGPPRPLPWGYYNSAPQRATVWQPSGYGDEIMVVIPDVVKQQNGDFERAGELIELECTVDFIDINYVHVDSHILCTPVIATIDLDRVSDKVGTEIN
ncbi:hypothetical protein Tco_0265570 [Tanacetum coccineum]